MPKITQEIEVTVEFEIWCSSCGKPLCRKTTVEDGNQVKVEPCQSCLGTEYQRGVDDGKSSLSAQL